MLVEFSLTNILSAIVGKIFKFMVFMFLENALSLCIFTQAPVPHSKLEAEYFPNFPSRKIYFPQAERGRENYDMIYQNSIRKYEWALEN